MTKKIFVLLNSETYNTSEVYPAAASADKDLLKRWRRPPGRPWPEGLDFCDNFTIDECSFLETPDDD